MDNQSQQRSRQQFSKVSPRRMIGKAVDLLISAMAILLTGSALIKFFKSRRQAGNPLRGITKSELIADERHQQQSRHQTSEIDLRGITWLAVGLVISAIAVGLLGAGLFSLFKDQYPSESAPSRITTSGRWPPAPRLQTDPASDWHQLQAAEAARLSSYGWIDKSAGVIRIPIDRAMDLLAQRGLPARDDYHESGGETPLQMRQEKTEATAP